ncbi:hypothetical protein LTR85_008826 [Meristemomyces frigidus]|nr:hypothetical protein LTR85_008826 [Meristemomyces frigidus]
MLADRELEQTAAQLADFRLASSRHQETLAEVLEKYGMLVEDYKRLKSDYEEERESRERYKQMARGQERNPFVLVLIDGDGYIFDDDLVSSSAEGGQRAAQLLDDAVKRSMRDRGLEQCRIMVRVYANLAGLSKALARSNLAGKEKRSLAPFAANFTRSNDLFDFVDAGELKENADFKIRAMFRQFAENAQCKHIYFAGCHDVGYINELTPYASSRDRITLVRTYAFHPEFNKLGMRIEDFPNIFRSGPLTGEPALHKAAPTRSPVKAAPNAQGSSGASMEGGQKVCYFFQKGKCTYGDQCKNLHIKQNANGQSAKTAGNLNDIRKWRDDASDGRASMPFQMSNLTMNDNNFMSGHAAITSTNNSNETLPNQMDSHNGLPNAADIPPGHIPINKDGHRLDPVLPQTSAADHEAFKTRTAVQKLCNNYHVGGYCPQGDACPYDHRPASPGVLNVLKQVVYSGPCPRKGSCRRTVCLNGHVCQKAECTHRGGKAYCKFSRPVHGIDLNVAEYVKGEGPSAASRSQQAAGVHNGGAASPEDSTSEQGSQRPTQPSSEWQTDSDGDDGEPEAAEGALLDFGDDASPN